MGGPGALLKVTESVPAMRAALDRIDDQASGQHLSHTGRAVAW